MLSSELIVRPLNASNKVVTVIGKDDRPLAPCTFKRASKLVARKCAIWVGYNVVKLLISEEDRKQLRREIVKEANRICYICGEYIPEDQHPTLDHVRPKWDLGEDKKENLKCCCKRCNDDKSDTLLHDYILHIELNREDYPWITQQQLDILHIVADEYAIVS